PRLPCAHPFRTHETDGSRVVDRRIGIWHRTHRCEATGQGTAGPAPDRLLVLTAGLAQVHVYIDEARSDDEPAHVDHLGIVRRAEPGPDRLHAALAQEHISDTVLVRRGIDDVSAAQQQWSYFVRWHPQRSTLPPLPPPPGRVHHRRGGRAPPCARRHRS